MVITKGQTNSKFFSRVVNGLLILVIMLSGQSVSAQNKNNAYNRPNILFILSDDHSVPYLGCYGNPDLKTPNLDRIAEEGMRFDHMYTTAPQCAPSRSSIMTGRSVIDIQQSRFSSSLRPDLPVYPELLGNAGYYTGICGRGYHTDGSYSKPDITQQVFDEYNLTTMPHRVDYLIPPKEDQDVLGQVQTFLDQVPKGKPWFLQAGFSNPHRPFTAGDDEPDPDKITVPEGLPDTRLVRKDLAAHYGEIQRLDFHVGQLMKELEKRGVKENTLIVFMGDNGAALWRGKGTLWDYGLHVPLIAALPDRVPAGTVSKVLLSGEDIAPTFLDLAGINPPEEMTGKSFLPVLEGSAKEIREYNFAVRGSHASSLPMNTAAFDLSRTVFNKDYKLIYNALWQLPYAPVDFSGQKFWKEAVKLHREGRFDERFDNNVFADPRPMFEFYDRRKDPQELNNLAGQEAYADIEWQLKEELHQWMILNWDYLPLPINKNRLSDTDEPATNGH